MHEQVNLNQSLQHVDAFVPQYRFVDVYKEKYICDEYQTRQEFYQRK